MKLLLDEFSDIKPLAPDILQSLKTLKPGEFVHINAPE
jgi:hypothetical protein